MSAYPVYETVANLVVAINTELEAFAAAHASGEFVGVHAEIPYVQDLITRAADLKEDAFADLDAVQSWLLDVAIVGPHLWD